MDLSLLKIAEKTAPRYTSYPTAPMFSADVSAETYGKWLGELNDDATLSLYLHIPYCKSICLYCGCHTFATRKEAPVLDYADTLIKEIQFLGVRFLRKGETPLRTVLNMMRSRLTGIAYSSERDGPRRN
jgi:oxygen-independent coproporphyrinogen-3 oxidase